MSDISELETSGRRNIRQENVNLKAVEPNQVKYGEKPYTTRSLRCKRIYHFVNHAKNLPVFKRLIKTWDGVSCKCNLRAKP